MVDVLKKNQIRRIYSDNPVIEEIIGEARPIINEHVVLKYGGHSSNFLQFSKIASIPSNLSIVAFEIAKNFARVPVNKVITMALPGNIPLSVALASEMKSTVMRILQGKSVATVMADVDKRHYPVGLRRGFDIQDGDYVLISTDVITTGHGVRDLAKIVKEAGGTLAGIASFANRGLTPLEEIARDVGLPIDKVFALVEFDFDHFDANNENRCEHCGPDGPKSFKELD